MLRINRTITSGDRLRRESFHLSFGPLQCFIVSGGRHITRHCINGR